MVSNNERSLGQHEGIVPDLSETSIHLAVVMVCLRNQAALGDEVIGLCRCVLPLMFHLKYSL